MTPKKTQVVSVALRKGGVGKTTTAQHLAHLLALRGLRVCMIDMDPQGSLTNRYGDDWRYTLADAFGVGHTEEKISLLDIAVETHQPGVWLVPGSEDLSKVNKVLDRELNLQYELDRKLNDEPIPFDYVVIDTPPGESALLIAALIASDKVVVPVHLSPMGFEGFSQIDESIQKARDAQDIRGNLRLKYAAIIPTFYVRREINSERFLEVLRESEHPDYAGVPLPVTPPVEESTMFKRASAQRAVEGIMRALLVWEQSDDEIIERATRAYANLANMVMEGA